ncbi:MAG: DUF2079 domain-containing protein [Pegethrix bostrychoides GSE-TBD4-15B]|jgi:uncharacterized membrane protein|uniref:DUF2079 domain-containing protein n=1 Tax=Pegethrix bostrychoides GSE-TBD4-15B TaxID=2839662 RepID=A0A951PBJ6_9CYAN|nr:DUF2079 domain-containing protein [Pegethrix bostrychoides GSE-TBD4-15B]
MLDNVDPPRHSQVATPKAALKTLRTHALTRWIAGTALLLFLCSSTRHLLFKSTAFDLGIYDQVVYLISQGLPAISTFLGFHHMGNHTAYSVYLLAPLYRLYPSVYWLLLVQAVCLALGAWPTFLLARQAGLTQSLAQAMAAAYLLYPVIFNVNLFDFHPEVMMPPVLLLAIWAARADRKLIFCLAIVFVLGCKDALSPVIAAMGLWLLLFEKRRFYGLFALLTGTGWFLLATQVIIPSLSGNEAAAVKRYAYLGDSVFGIAQNLILKPGIVLGRIFSFSTVSYLVLLLSPLVWGLSPRYLAPLISASPTLIFNILSDAEGQRSLQGQYSLPILPFLLVSVIAALAAEKTWLRSRRWIMLWSLIGFLAIAKWTWFFTEPREVRDSWQATREAIALIPPHDGGVITNNYLGAHLSQRPFVTLVRTRTFNQDLAQSDYLLFNLDHIAVQSQEKTAKVLQRIQKQPEFELTYERDEVYLFQRKQISQP